MPIDYDKLKDTLEQLYDRKISVDDALLCVFTILGQSNRQERIQEMEKIVASVQEKIDKERNWQRAERLVEERRRIEQSA